MNPADLRTTRAHAKAGGMTLRQLEYFVQAAKMGSINRAAKTLLVAQSAMSRQLHLLEHEVGVALLIRTRTGIELTQDGRRFLAYSSRALELLAQSRDVLGRT